ncbi:L-arabinose isomerase [Aquipuribacter sp. SD81]|uniref:L-arabinose isomerase n=1 Tax=Aquipuribacter sp. SD81 TaxID=3127703 RepID=UPI0030174361
MSTTTSGGSRSEQAAGPREIWFVTGSQGLYGQDVLDQVAEQSRQVAERLQASGALPVGLSWRPVVTSVDAVHRLALEANADPSCVGVVAWMHTFSPARMWIRGLDALQTPLLHLHTQANESLPWSTIDMDFMNLNQAAHGDREFGYVQTRMGVVRKTVVGHASDAHVTSRLSAWARAALAWHESRSLTVARFGDTMRDVAVTEGDRTEAQWRWGVRVNAYAVDDVVRAVADVSDADVDPLVAEYEDCYDVVDELRKGGDRHDSLRYAARQELALRRLLDQVGARAFTTNFEDLAGLRQLPGLAVQRLMADGYGFGGEGDWKTSALLRMLKVAGAGLAGGTSFMEDYTYHFGPGEPLSLGAHMLEVCPSIAAERPRVEIHPLGIGDREDPVRLVFDAAPGRALVSSLVDLGDRFRVVANEVEVVAPPEPLPHLPVGRAVWRPEPDLRTSAECWIVAGGSHHTVLSTQLDAEVLTDLARIARCELALIDADTRPHRFEQELRWNEAYHRLVR